MDSVAARIGYNLATGLDDRGVMYLRFGPPDKSFVGGKNDVDPKCSVPDVERWQYAEYGEVRRWLRRHRLTGCPGEATLA